MRTLGANNPGWKKSLAGWAKKKGLSRAKGQQLGGTGKAPCCYGLANKVVLSKVKAQLGLDKVRGLGPLAWALGWRFSEVNHQSYGETAGA